MYCRTGSTKTSSKVTNRGILTEVETDMNTDIYWQAQWAISELEEINYKSDAEYAALDVLLQLRDD